MVEIKDLLSDIVLGVAVSNDGGWPYGTTAAITYATTIKNGMLIKNDGTLAAVADATDVIGVLADERLVGGLCDCDGGLEVGKDYKFSYITRGGTLNKIKLFYSDGTTAIDADGITALEARSNKVTDLYIVVDV